MFLGVHSIIAMDAFHFEEKNERLPSKPFYNN